LLQLAIRRSGLPLKLFDSSTGFRLSDGSVLSVEQLRRWAQSASRGDADASHSPKSLV
jgi:hypothetical protein